jgi:hypothetical protein
MAVVGLPPTAAICGRIPEQRDRRGVMNANNLLHAMEY